MHDDSMKPRGGLLVFGGSGAVGRFLLRRLAIERLAVTAISRQPRPAWSNDWPTLDWRCGSLQRCPSPPVDCIDAVLSAGPLDAFADWLPQAGLQPGTRVVALSSMSVVWKQHSPLPAERRLAAHLHDCETRLAADAAARGLTLQLLRPTLIYGAGIDHSLSRLLAIARRSGFLPWPRGGRGLRQPVHADDVAAAMISAICREPAAAALQLPGGETVAFDELLRRLLAAVLPSYRLLPVPLPVSLLGRLTAGGGRLGRLAAPLYRSHFDQLADDRDWMRLQVEPRRFVPEAADFLHW